MYFSDFTGKITFAWAIYKLNVNGGGRLREPLVKTTPL